MKQKKTKNKKVSTTRRCYSAEFKLKPIRLHTEKGYPSDLVAQELSIGKISPKNS